MLNGFLLTGTSVGAGFGIAAFFALLAGGEEGGFLATEVSVSAISAVDGSLRALDHEINVLPQLRLHRIGLPVGLPFPFVIMAFRRICHF